MVTRPGNRVARRYPLVPGVDLAGSVIESGDPSLRPGQAVLVQGYDLGVAHHGGFAGCARVPADWVVPLPDDVHAPGRRHHRHRRVHRVALAPPLAGARRDARRRAGAGHRRLRWRGQHHGGAAGPPRLRGGGLHRQDSRARATSRTSGPLASSAAPSPPRTAGRSARNSGARVVDCVGGSALAEALRTTRYGGAVAASGLTGGNELTTTVYPFIVRGVALLGIDTVATPIDERRALWATMATEFPMDRCEAMVDKEIGLGDLTEALKLVLDGRRARAHPRRPAPLTRPAVSSPRRRRPATRRRCRCCTAPSSTAPGPTRVDAPGGVTDTVVELAHDVSAPVTTSEYWKVNSACWPARQRDHATAAGWAAPTGSRSARSPW